MNSSKTGWIYGLTGIKKLPMGILLFNQPVYWVFDRFSMFTSTWVKISLLLPWLNRIMKSPMVILVCIQPVYWVFERDSPQKTIVMYQKQSPWQPHELVGRCLWQNGWCITPKGCTRKPVSESGKILKDRFLDPHQWVWVSLNLYVLRRGVWCGPQNSYITWDGPGYFPGYWKTPGSTNSSLAVKKWTRIESIVVPSLENGVRPISQQSAMFHRLVYHKCHPGSSWRTYPHPGTSGRKLPIPQRRWGHFCGGESVGLCHVPLKKAKVVRILPDQGGPPTSGVSSPPINGRKYVGLPEMISPYL